MKHKIIKLVTISMCMSFFASALVLTNSNIANNNNIIEVDAWSGTQTSDYPDGYYDSAFGKTGSSLKYELQSFNKPKSISNDWSRYEDADEAENDSSSILSIYTRHNISKSSHCGTYSWTKWNKEHIYPQGAFPASDSDNHNIYACEGQINNYRGSYDFGEVAHTSKNQLEVHGHLTDCYREGSYFEPCDDAKGEVARAVMYTSIYYGYNITDIFQSEALCLKWHNDFPVTNRDIFRNNAVYDNQGNRNPFVDYPGFADAIWGDGGSVEPEPTYSISVEPSSLNMLVNSTKQLSVSSNYGETQYTYSSSNSAVASVSSSGLVSASKTGSATITVQASHEGETIKDTCTVSVGEPSISISPTSSDLLIGKTLQLTPSSNYDEDYYTYSSEDSNVANVSSSGLVEGISEGTSKITIKANHNGTDLYAYITINVITQLITSGNMAMVSSVSEITDSTKYVIGAKVDDEFIIMNASSSEGKPNGIIKTLESDGSFVLDESIDDVGYTFSGSGSSYSVLNANGKYFASSSSSTPSWSSSESFCDVSIGSDGIATIKNNRELHYRSTSNDFRTYTTGFSTTDVYKVNIFKLGSTSSVPITNVDITNSVTSLNLSTNSYQLNATVLPTNASNKQLIWSSSNTGIATVSSSGLLTLKSSGNVVISAKSSDGSNINDTISLSIVNDIVNPSIEINNPISRVDIATNSYQLEVSTNPLNLDVIYESNNHDIATVSNTGLITFKNVGNVVISAVLADYSEEKDSFTLEIFENSTGGDDSSTSGNTSSGDSSTSSSDTTTSTGGSTSSDGTSSENNSSSSTGEDTTNDNNSNEMMIVMTCVLSIVGLGVISGSLFYIIKIYKKK